MAILSKVYLGSTAIGRIALGANIIDLLPFFPDDPGLVTTNGANLTSAALTGTNPAAMVHGVWITAPEVLAAETTLWLNTVDNAGTTERAYVTIYDTGERLVSIYTRDSGGVLQPSVSEYITNDPIQPGDRVFLALSVSAGGTLHSYQIRNGANFTRGTGVAISPGHTMPVHGAAHRFYDSDNIHTEGSFLWPLASLPAEFTDLASLNAAKTSFVEADGTRAPLNSIYGILGEPLHAIYGTAADYNAATDRGTSAGILTLSGTFADYVPSEPAAPSLAQPVLFGADTRLESPTPTTSATSSAFIFASVVVPPLGVDRSIWQHTSSSYQIKIKADNTLQVIIGSSSNQSSALGRAVIEGETLHILVAADGVNTRTQIRSSTGTHLFTVASTALPVGATGRVRVGGVFSGEYFGGVVKRVMYWQDGLAVPDLSDATVMDQFVSGDNVLADMGSVIGAYGDSTQGLFLDVTGPAADINAVPVVHGGSLSLTKVGSDVTDAAPASALTAVSDPNADLLAGSASNYALTQSAVESYGSTAFDYSAVTLTASKSSIMIGEAVYLAVNGLTDEQRATWGFIWEFDTTGEFQFLAGLPWHIRQRNRATGHHQTAAWNKADGPGAKTVRVHIVPPAWTGLKGKTLEVATTVRDPDVEFAGVTVYVATDGDFTGVPAEVGATERVTTFADGYSRLRAWNGGRMRFKRGQTIPITSHIEISRAYAHGVMFDDWGDALNPLPILDISTIGLMWTRPETATYVILNLNHVGAYDGVTGTVATSPEKTPSAYSVSAQGASITLNGCKFEKMMKAADIINVGEVLGNHLAAYDCNITRWQDFGLYSARANIMVRGCAIYQDPDFPVSMSEWSPTKAAIDPKNYNGPKDYANHGPMRFNKMSDCNVVISQMRVFSISGWGTGSNSTIDSQIAPVAGQQATRIGALDCENTNALYAEVYSDGGGVVIGGGNAGYTVGSGLCAMHGCYHVFHAGWNTSGGGMTGTWIRNNVWVVPQITGYDTNPSTWQPWGSVASAQVTATWHTKPVNMFDNTVIWLKGQANINGSTPPTAAEIFGRTLGGVQPQEPVVNVYDNVIWAPNITLSGEASPRVPVGLTKAGRYGPLPLYKGWHQIQGNTNVGETALGLYPEFATDPAAPELPIAGLTYEGRGAGDPTKPHGALDFHGRIKAERDTGAVAYEVLKPAS